MTLNALFLKFVYLVTIFSTFSLAHTTVKTEKNHDAALHYARNPPLLHVLEKLETLIYRLFHILERDIQENRIQVYSNKSVLELANGLRSYLKDYDETTLKLKREYQSPWNKNGSYKVGWNPLASMRMIRRLSKDAPEILRHVEFLDISLDAASEISKILDLMDTRNISYPTSEDYNEALDGILNIQSTYIMEAEDMAEGLLFGTDTRIKLMGIDCLHIGSYAFKSNYYELSLAWLRLAIKKFEEQNSSKDLPLAKKLLQKAVLLHDKKLNTNSAEVLRSKMDSDLHGAMYDNSLDTNGHSSVHSSSVMTMFTQLCARGSSQTPAEQAELFCWYETQFSPYLRIHPAKIELLSKAPLIVRYHQLLGEKLIKFLINHSSDRLKPSSVGRNNNGVVSIEYQGRTSLDYTMDSSAVNGANYTRVGLLDEELRSVSGFKLNSAHDSDPLVVISYAVGTFFGPHMDAIRIPPYHEEGGDRIATFLLYLSDVELGGGTAFMHPRILVKPIQGSGIFWYNINAGGYADEKTIHAGCPVVLGEKWISNKWICASNQFRPYKCEEGGKSLKFYANGKWLNVVDERNQVGTKLVDGPKGLI